MTVLLFVIFTIIIGLTVEHFVQRKEKITLRSQHLFKNLSLPKLLKMVPAGIFIQPSFTWSRIMDSGSLMLGIHPILMGLTGKPDIVETLEKSTTVKKGDTLITINKDSKKLHVKAPIDGTITAINPNFSETSWNDLGNIWLYVIKPENISEELPNWFIAENSKIWLNNNFQQIKNFFVQSLPQKQTGITMADGGELPVGVLADFSDKIWKEFEIKFFN